MNNKLQVFVAVLIVALFMGMNNVIAQSNDFEGDTIGDTYGVLGWSADDIDAVVADDPVSSGNNVLEVTLTNYNSAPFLALEIPAGKTLADYDTFNFKGYFASGDVGYKTLLVHAYASDPSGGPFANADNNAPDVELGSLARDQGTSTAWENISIDISNSSDLSGTVYIAFGFNGGSEATTWYADDVEMVEAASGGSTGIAWGSINRHGWPIGETSATGASMGSDGPPEGGWASLRGEFETVTATESEAVVASGQLEFVGGGATSWSALRFGLFNMEEAGELYFAGTDSARWKREVYAGTDSAAIVDGSENSFGYMLSPKSGTNDHASGNGGNGVIWTLNGGSWISTWSGLTMGVVEPAPRRAEMTQGVYDFEISARPLADGTTEVSWYMFKTDESYWMGGTFIDTTAQKTDFNSIVFGINGGNGIAETGITGLNVSNVEITTGDMITIPEAPFSKFFIDQWGDIGGRLLGSGWTLDNDSTTLVGDAYLSGDEAPSNWTAIRGGFGQTISATMEEALIVRGEFEIIGGHVNVWSPFRLGVFNHTDIGTLHHQYTDSAQWGYTEYAGTDSAAFVSNESSAHGYLLTPRSGSNDAVSGNGGLGIAWTLNGGSWISTWSGLAMGHQNQAPRRAEFLPGTYEFEISVQPQADGTTELRWYIISEDEESYWHAGVHTDTTAQKTDFNGFTFSMANATEVEATGINLYAVQVDRGAPITIPPAPFDAFYASDWGFLGGKLGGTSETDSAWALTPGDLVGDVSVGGDAATGWANVGTHFGNSIIPTASEALRITADVTFEGGGFTEEGSFRFGVFNSNFGSLDSTDAVGYVYTGTDTATGYVISPAATGGTISTVENAPWYEAATSISDQTTSGVAEAGDYELTLAVWPNGSGGNNVAAKLEGDNGYRYEVANVDANAVATAFNSFAFGTNNSTTTGITIEALYVELVDPATITVSTEEGRGNDELPNAFALEQNYPNPFNPTTNIDFALPNAADVQLTVYNMLGQKVATLVNERMQAGAHQVTFDASSIASGMYVYRIEAGNFVSTKKMMLIK